MFVPLMPARPTCALTETLLSGATGTPDSDFDTRPTAWYDDVTAQAAAASSRKTGTSCYAQKTWAADKLITKAVAQAPTDDRFVSGVGSGTVYAVLSGYNGSTWTDLNTASGAPTVGQTLTMTYSGTTKYIAHKVLVYHSAGATENYYVAEAQYYETACS